jgi:hypothetical protein
MTMHWAEQQPVGYVTGLAEVLAGPAVHEHADPIVQFDRYQSNSAGRFVDASAHALSRANRRRLDQWGYVLVPDVGNAPAAEELVASLGDLIPQHNSRLTHDVAHTVAPGSDSSPAYVALFCHRQVRRAGHTDLLDVRKLVAALDTDEIALMTDAELHFPGPTRGVRSTMLSSDTAGDTVVRFDHHLLTTADHNLGEAGRRLAHRVSDLFRELHTSVVVPEGSLLIWDNQRMLHARSGYADRARHLTRFLCVDSRRA